ncbi:MAG: undecaprenyl-diphosphate phosphatase [Deltaproteobacteria bacterium]|jgi:undecaprenyl-diphosphatase|nr:undecaprenyl-diphosphate phosphatase [Deltaproteobacteria bacterium]
MATLAAAVILGLIQGLGEFLPISSSGHLVLAQAFLGLAEPEIFFDLVLHCGTLLAVIIFYRTSLAALFRELRLLPAALIFPSRMRAYYRLRPDFHLGILIIIGCLPTAVIGFLFQDTFESLFGSPRMTGAALLVTAAFLALTWRLQKPRILTPQSMTVRTALLIGLIQGLAITPGLSRSGLTIGLALMLGLENTLAARYSFLLSIPAVLGGMILTLAKSPASAFAWPQIGAGFLTAAIAGYAAIFLLVRIIKPRRLAFFAPWCAAAGLWALIFWR